MVISKNIRNVSQSCCELVTSSLDTFKLKMRNHDDICKSLAGKYSFLTKFLVDKQLKLLGDDVSIDEREHDSLPPRFKQLY